MAKQPFENVVQHLFQLAARVEFKTLNDRELLRRYVEQRDELAFGELVRRHKGMIWNICWRVLRHHQEVEDAFQATVMTLIRRARSILNHEAIEGWLHQVAYHIALKAKAIQMRRHAREERIAVMRKRSFEGDHRQLELAEIIDKEIMRIPEKFRIPLILCYMDRLSQEEAAQRLNTTIDSLKGRLRRGREQLKERLSKYGMDWEPTMLIAGTAPGMHIPEVPAGLVEKTLDMVRIVTLSNGALEISPQVAVLIKSAMGVWTVKMKILLGALLLTLVGVGGGMAKYAGWLSFRSEQPPQGIPGPANQDVDKPETPEKQSPRTDRYGDPLPAGALERLGTTRYRADKYYTIDHSIAVTSDKKLCILGDQRGSLSRCYDLETGKTVHQFQMARGQALSLTRDVRISFDGRLLTRRIKPSGDLGFWNLTTGEPLTLRTTSQPQQMALSRDGKMVAVMTATPGKDGFDLHIWDNTAGRYLWMKEDRSRSPRWIQMAISSDGKILLALCIPEFNQPSAPKESIFRRWEVATGKELPSWTVPLGWYFSWSYDGSTLATTSNESNNTICIWNMATGKQIRQIELGVKVRLGAFVLSPDGHWLAASTRSVEREVHPSLGVWDIATGKLLHRWHGQAGISSHIVFSQDGKWLVLSPMFSINRSIFIWNIESGKTVNQVWHDRGHNDAITSLDFSRQRQTLASCGRSGSLTLWNAVAGMDGYVMRPLRPSYSRDRACGGGAVALNGMVAAYMDRKQIHVWETATGHENNSFPAPTDGIHSRFVFSPNNKILALQRTYARDGKVSLYDLSTNKYFHSDLPSECVAFSPDSQWLAIGEKEGFCLWHTASRKAIARKPVGHVIDVAFSPDGRTLAVSTKVKDTLHVIQVWRWYADESGLRLEQLHPLITASGDTEFSLLTFSPDGRSLAARRGSMQQIRRDTANGSIHLWETATGQDRACFKDHGSYVTSLAFAPDGRRLASGHEDGTILIWDVTGRLEVGKLRLAHHFSDQTLAALWDKLASRDATRASQAMWQLASAGPRTVSFFKTRLHPLRENKVRAALLTRLIADLDNDAFAVRQKANRELHQLGKHAEARLREVLKKEISLEMRRTVQALLKKIEGEYIPRTLTTDELRGVRALEVLGQISHSEARDLLEALASGDAEASLTQEAQVSLNYWKNTHKPD